MWGLGVGGRGRVGGERVGGVSGKFPMYRNSREFSYV